MNPEIQRSGQLMLNPVIPILANSSLGVAAAALPKTGALSANFLMGVGNKAGAVEALGAMIGQVSPANFAAFLDNALPAQQFANSKAELKSNQAVSPQTTETTGPDNPATLEALRQALNRLEEAPNTDASFIAHLKNLLNKGLKPASTDEAAGSESIATRKTLSAALSAAAPADLNTLKDKDLQDLLNCPILGPIIQNLLQSLQAATTADPTQAPGIDTDATALSGNTKAMQGLLTRLSVVLTELRDALSAAAPVSAPVPIASTEILPTADPKDPPALQSIVQEASSASESSATPKTPDLLYFGNSQKDNAVYAVALEPLAKQNNPALERSSDGNVIVRLEKALNKIDQVIQEIQKTHHSNNGLNNESSLSPSSFIVSSPISDTANSSVLHMASTAPHSAMLARMDAVQQTQSAMADMVQRMKGEVTLNSSHMQATIHLDPPALGRIHINLAIDDTQNLQALVSADHAATQDFLQQNQQNLKHELAQQGFAPDKISIRFEDSDSEAFVDSLGATMPSV